MKLNAINDIKADKEKYKAYKGDCLGALKTEIENISGETAKDLAVICEQCKNTGKYDINYRDKIRGLIERFNNANILRCIDYNHTTGSGSGGHTNSGGSGSYRDKDDKSKGNSTQPVDNTNRSGLVDEDSKGKKYLNETVDSLVENKETINNAIRDMSKEKINSINKISDRDNRHKLYGKYSPKTKAKIIVSLEYLKRRGLMVGDKNGNFNAGKILSRAEAAQLSLNILELSEYVKMISKQIQASEDIKDINKFKDVGKINGTIIL